MINVKRYVINYSKLVTQRIPEELSVDEVINFVKVLVSPVVTLYNQLIAFRDLLLYKITITPQVVYLEKMLNDRYDNIERRIYIEDGLTYDPIYVYTEAELKPIYLYTESEMGPGNFLFTQGEVSQVSNDFIVYVPLAVSFDVNEMTSLVSAYKLASKLFKIQTF